MSLGFKKLLSLYWRKSNKLNTSFNISNYSNGNKPPNTTTNNNKTIKNNIALLEKEIEGRKIANKLIQLQKIKELISAQITLHPKRSGCFSFFKPMPSGLQALDHVLRNIDVIYNIKDAIASFKIKYNQNTITDPVEIISYQNDYSNLNHIIKSIDSCYQRTKYITKAKMLFTPSFGNRSRSTAKCYEQCYEIMYRKEFRSLNAKHQYLKNIIKKEVADNKLKLGIYLNCLPFKKWPEHVKKISTLLEGYPKHLNGNIEEVELTWREIKCCLCMAIVKNCDLNDINSTTNEEKINSIKLAGLEKVLNGYIKDFGNPQRMYQCSRHIEVQNWYISTLKKMLEIEKLKLSTNTKIKIQPLLP